MKKALLLCSAAVALLLPGVLRAQDPAPVPPGQPNTPQLREELRNLPPEERRARMRELRGENAQPGRPGNHPLVNRLAAQGPGGMGGAGQMARIFTILTPEQRESLRDATETDREKMRDLQEKLRDARKAAAEAGFAKKFDEAALREKLDAANKLDTELAIMRARALSNIEPPLTDEQIEKLKSPLQIEPAQARFPGGVQRPPNAVQPRGDLPLGNPPVRRGPPPGGQAPPPQRF
jgi:Spy/CpxP family protein refolding chaperone